MAFADRDLTQRNFQALSEGLKDIRGKFADLLEEVKAMREANGVLAQENANMKQQMGILLARFHGTGSTS